MLPPGVNAEMFELLSITVSSLTLVIVVMVIVAPVAFIDLTARLVAVWRPNPPGRRDRSGPPSRRRRPPVGRAV